MLRTIIPGLLLLLCTKAARAQETLDRQLLLLEEKAFADTSAASKNQLYYQKFQLYIDAHTYTADALAASQRIDEQLLPDSLRTRFLWNAALMAHLNHEQRLAIHQLNKYKALGDSTSMQVYLLEALASADYDTVRINQIATKVKDSMACISCLNEVSRYERKHKTAYVIASAIVPGSGTIANGQVGKGLASLALTGGFAYLTYSMFSHKLYINALGWGIGWGYKFYTGNIRLTASEFDKKEARQKNKLAVDCELTLNELMKKYPVSFR